MTTISRERKEADSKIADVNSQVDVFEHASSSDVRSAIERILKCQNTIDEATEFLTEVLPKTDSWNWAKESDLDSCSDGLNKLHATHLYESIKTTAFAIFESEDGSNETALAYFKETAQTYFNSIPEEYRETAKANVYKETYNETLVNLGKKVDVTIFPNALKPICPSERKKEVSQSEETDSGVIEQAASVAAYAGDRALHGAIYALQLPAIGAINAANLAGAELPDLPKQQRDLAAGAIQGGLSAAASYAASFLLGSSQTDTE